MKDLLIAQVPLLASLPAAELERLSRVLVLRTYAAGSVLFREGERGQSLFSIVSGQAQVVKALGSEDERIVGVSGPGDFVGEMSLLSPDSLRTASVLCVGELEALELPRAEFDSLLQRFPSVGLQLISVLGRRLDATNNATIHDLHEKNRAITLSHAELSVAHARLKRTRHFAIMLLSMLLLIVGVVAALLAYYQFSVRSALDTPSDLLLIMAELGRNINVPAEAAALKNPQPLSSEVVVNARRAYTGRCSGCHGPDGKGDTAIGAHIFPRTPDLTAEHTQSRTDGALFWIIQNGSPRTAMPGWKGTLSDEELWQIVSYVRLLTGGLDAVAKWLPTPTAAPTPTTAPTPTAQPSPTAISLATALPRPSAPATVIPAAVQAGRTVTVTIADYEYVPAQLTVPAGSTVAWLNKDDDTHNINSDVTPPLLDSPVLYLGGVYAMTFAKPGTYAYSCTLHDFMHATVVVE